MNNSPYKHRLQHLAFWGGYYLLLVYLLGKGDGSFGRVFIGEAIQLPAKIAATYILFAFIEKQGKQERYLLIIATVIGVIIAAAFVNRSLMYYWIRPTWFQDYYMFFWDEYRFTLDITDVGIPVTGALMLRMLRARLSGRQQEVSLRREKTEAELQLLRSQVNPHFLFNTLNSIYALAQSGSALTANATMQLSNILRFALYDSSQDLVSITKEVALIRDYLALEKLRYEEGRLSLTFYESLHTPDTHISPMLLLPLVENAFKHGSAPAQKAVTITISIESREQCVEMRVENTVDAHNSLHTAHHSRNGIGVANVQKQLALLYPGRSFLHIHSDAEYFRVHLCIHTEDFRRSV